MKGQPFLLLHLSLVRSDSLLRPVGSCRMGKVFRSGMQVRNHFSRNPRSTNHRKRWAETSLWVRSVCTQEKSGDEQEENEHIGPGHGRSIPKCFKIRASNSSSVLQ